MRRPFELLKETPSQTAGPYVHIGMTPNAFDITGVTPNDLGDRLISGEARGDRITIAGRVLDGGDNPVSDCIIEIWQADSAGLFNSRMDRRAGADPHFFGWGRQASDEEGAYRFETIKPGPVPAPGRGVQAPHVSFWIVARGINIGLHTRMYFSDEPVANQADALLARARQIGRDHTMIGRREGGVVTFDIRLQGEHETVFLDI